MPYCTPAQAINYFDSTMLGQLTDDTGVQLTEAQLAASPKLLAALSSASGQINSAIRVSNRYQVSDIQSLTGDDAEMLARLTAWLAIPILMGRRNPSLDNYPEIEEAQTFLQMIRYGERIFDVAEAAEAGLPKQVDFTSSNSIPKTSSYCRAGRFFGVRGWMMGKCCQNNGGCG